MQMLDLMKRLSELDAKNPNVVNEQGVDEAVRVMGRTGQGEPMQRMAKGAPGAAVHRDTTAAMAKQARATGNTLRNDSPVDIGATSKYPDKQVMKYQSKDVETGVAEDRIPVQVDGKMVDLSSIEIDGIDTRDYPDFSDAYISYATFADGTPLSDDQLDKLTDERGDIVNQMAYDKAVGESIQQPVAESINECGMMDGMGGMSQPHTPASINVTAGSGSELSAMLKDILSLAGLHKVEPAHLGIQSEPTVVTMEPDISVSSTDGGSSMMRSMLDKLNPDDEEETPEAIGEPQYDTTPADPNSAAPFDAEEFAHHENPPGSAKGRGNMNNPRATTAYESLMSEYQKYISEN